MFLVVSFNDGMEVIPKSWYLSKTQKAYYPPGKISKLSWRNILRRCCPPEKNWTQHDVLKVWTETDDFDKAMRLLDHYLRVSESEMSEVDVIHKRRRSIIETRPSKFRKVVESDKLKKNYMVEMSEESSEERTSNLAPFPQLQNEDHLSENELEVEEGCDEEMDSFLNQDETRHRVLREVDRENISKLQRKVSSLNSKRVESEDVDSDESLAEESNKKKYKEMSNRDFQNVMLKHFHNVKKKISKVIIEQKRLAEKQTELMERFLQTQRVEKIPVHDDMRKRLPLKSSEELDALCILISDANEMDKLVKLLKLSGGVDIKQSCKLSLRKLLVDDLASKYSFQGRRSKPAFHHFLVNEAIRLSIRSRFPDALDSEINKRIEDYLRYAPQREKRDVLKSVPVTVDQPVEEERGCLVSQENLIPS